VSVTYVYLSVELGGNGSGAWQSVDGQTIDCRIVNGYVDPREQCDAQLALGPDGSVTVVYNLIPATGSCVLLSPGNCVGAIMGASTTFSGDLTKTAIFNLAKFPVNVTKSGAGTGTVSSTPSGVSCGATCSASFEYGSSVTLTAVADPGAYFQGWTGACAGKGAACALTISGATSTNAVFGFGTAPTPSPSAGATPVVTPVATVRITAGPNATKPAATPKASAPPGATAAPSTLDATATPDPLATEAGSPPAAEPTTTVPPQSAAGAGSLPPIAPAGGTAEVGPIALAILGAGLLIAVGIGVAGFLLTRRRTAPPA
jgi:hypothetical protein